MSEYPIAMIEKDSGLDLLLRSRKPREEKDSEFLITDSTIKTAVIVLEEFLDYSNLSISMN